jgi:hypothetical protein
LEKGGLPYRSLPRVGDPTQSRLYIDPIPFQGTNDILHCLTVRLISDARKESDARPVCFSGYSFVQLNSDFRAEPIHRSTLDSVLCGHGCGMYIHDTPQTNIIIEQ